MVRNKYLEKIAGMPGSFMAAAHKDSVQGIMSNDPKSSISGLPSGPNVTRTQNAQVKPRVIQNRTGMSRDVLTNKVG